MNDEVSKAVVITATSEPVKVPFRNLTYPPGQQIIQNNMSGILIVFNGLEPILFSGTNKNAAKKLIEGLSLEISTAYTSGWNVIHYCSFDQFKNPTNSDLPEEFPSSKEDCFFCDRKRMIFMIHSVINSIKTVRFVGIISERELNEIVHSMSKSTVNIETDSPYLITV